MKQKPTFIALWLVITFEKVLADINDDRAGS
jgi:hypothetical protein